MMRTATRVCFTVALFVLFAPMLLVLTSSSADAQGAAPWDHYKVYEVRNGTGIGTSVQLTDQFGSWPHSVDMLERFANPVQKLLSDGTGAPIFNPQLHYAWWRISPTPFSGVVDADNQFGLQTFIVQNAAYLWNPALKNETGPLPEANHYKCYDCNGDPVGVQVEMIDQFGTYQAMVAMPRFFCNPVRKDVEGATYPIIDPDQHYVCYIFSPADPRTFSAVMSDQFITGYQMDLDNSHLLCVPTSKVDPTPTSKNTWGRLKTIYR